MVHSYKLLSFTSICLPKKTTKGVSDPAAPPQRALGASGGAPNVAAGILCLKCGRREAGGEWISKEAKEAVSIFI